MSKKLHDILKHYGYDEKTSERLEELGYTPDQARKLSEEDRPPDVAGLHLVTGPLGLTADESALLAGLGVTAESATYVIEVMNTQDYTPEDVRRLFKNSADARIPPTDFFPPFFEDSDDLVLRCPDPDPEVVYTTDDLDNVCDPPPKGETIIFNPEMEPTTLRETLDALGDVIAESAAEQESLRGKIDECVGQIAKAAGDIRAENEAAGRKAATAAKLVGIRDTTYPLYVYHKTRYDILSPTVAYTKSQLRSFKSGSNFSKFRRVYNKVSKIRVTIPGVGALGGTDVPETYGDFSTATEITVNGVNALGRSLPGDGRLLSATTYWRRGERPPEQNTVNPDGTDGPMERPAVSDWRSELGDPGVARPIVNGFSISPKSADADPEGGALYEFFYDRMGDVMTEFFTPGEMGMSENPEEVDPRLQGNEDPRSKEFQVKEGETHWIADGDVVKEFFSNAEENVKDRLEVVKARRIEDTPGNSTEGAPRKVVALRSRLLSAFDAAVGEMGALGRAEAEYYMFKGNESNQANGAREQSRAFLEWWDGMEGELASVEEAAGKTTKDPDEMVRRMRDGGATCIDPPGDADEPPEQEVDLRKSFRSPDPTRPHPQKRCYWAKFARDATDVGMLPYPDIHYRGAGFSFRYWPIGFVVPTPTGLINIPMPVVWKPLLVISGPFGRIVAFLGVCGVFPMPYLFLNTNRCSKMFALTIWGMSDDFGSKAGDNPLQEPLLVPAINNVEPSVDIPLNDFDDLLDEVRRLIFDMIDKLEPAQLPVLDVGGAGGDLGVGEKLERARQALHQLVDEMTVPSTTIPRDTGKIANLGVLDQFRKEVEDLLGRRAPTKGINMKDLALAELDRAAREMGLDDLPGDVNVKQSADFNVLKQYFRNMIDELVSRVEKLPVMRSLLSYPMPTISAADACEDKLFDVPPFDAIAKMFVDTLRRALNSIVDDLGPNGLVSLFGGGHVFPSKDLAGMARELIRKYLPDMVLPDAAFLADYAEALLKIAKLLGLAFDRKYSLPSLFGALLKQLGLPVPLDTASVLPLDIVKNLIKERIDEVFSSGPATVASVAGDILDDGVYRDLGPLDMKPVLKTVAERALGELAKTLDAPYAVYALLGVLRGHERNLLDVIQEPNPFFAAKSLKDFAVAAAMSMTPLDKLITQVDPSRVGEVLAKLGGSKLPYPAAAAMAAFAPTEEARNAAKFALHPFMAHDDLPPWERMDINSNPLYVFFLDEFCYQGKKFHFQSAAFGPHPTIYPGMPKRGTG